MLVKILGQCGQLSDRIKLLMGPKSKLNFFFLPRYFAEFSESYPFLGYSLRRSIKLGLVWLPMSFIEIILHCDSRNGMSSRKQVSV